jgi:uncharacterized cupredoxin-like copper-binding protein
MSGKRLLALCGLLATAAALAACGGSSSGSSTSGSSAVVDVVVGSADNEYLLAPDPAEAQAGTITFKAANSGSMTHEMVVIKTDKAAGDLATASGEADETGAVDEVELPAGATADLTVDLEPGHYALVCNIGDHYSRGMYADFTVK